MRFRLQRRRRLTIEDHEGGVRRLVSESRGEPYVALPSLEEARQDPEGIVVLEGDDGGQIYVVCPASCVVCGARELDRLLRFIDDKAWPGNDPNSARVLYERRAVGSPVVGGMGGARVIDGVWIHPEFQHLRSDIEAVIAGQPSSIGEGPPTARQGDP